MTIVKLQPSSGLLNTTTTLPEAFSAPNQSTFTTLYPESKVDSLLKYVEGYPWTVHYYGQIVNTADTLEHVDPGTPSFTQPYYEVLGAVLQVSSPLTSSYDESTSVTSVTGSALMPFKLTPNVGDLFVAQVDSGQDAFFIVNSVYRKTHRKDTLYEVNYSLYQYVSASALMLAELKAKVQETYHFNKDSQHYNRDNLLAPAQYKAALSLKALVAQSQAYYFERFVQRDSGTLLVPGVDKRMYDGFLCNFIYRTVSHDAFGTKGLVKHSQYERYAKQPVLWDLVMARESERMYSVNKSVGFLHSASLKNLGRIGSHFHAGIDYVACAVEPNLKADVSFYPQRGETLWHREYLTPENSAVFAKLVRTQNNAVTADKKLLHPLFAQDHYVVSPAFYSYLQDNTFFADISYIEWTLARFLQRQALAKQDVCNALDSYGQWSVLHQFYLLPLLWLIAKTAD